MAKPAIQHEDMPTHPGAPKTVAKRASAHGGANSFVKGGKKGKAKKKSHKKHAKK
jgi:hypothetical protein